MVEAPTHITPGGGSTSPGACPSNGGRRRTRPGASWVGTGIDDDTGGAAKRGGSQGIRTESRSSFGLSTLVRLAPERVGLVEVWPNAPTKSFLEFHHCEPYAIGGEPTVGNISLRCRAHNVYEAERVFGAWAGRAGRLAPDELSPRSSLGVYQNRKARLRVDRRPDHGPRSSRGDEVSVGAGGAHLISNPLMQL
jgi:hypothetical protein